MQSVGFVSPILPGKTEIDRVAMRSCAEGERKEAHHTSRERRGITRESVWIQQTPRGDFAVVYMEADDLQAAMAGLGDSPDPFDSWFVSTSWRSTGSTSRTAFRLQSRSSTSGASQ